MAITYTTNDRFPGVKFPVLHKVVYAKTADNMPAWTQQSYKDYLVNTWLQQNCKHPYYHSPGYLREKFIQFEDDAEAVLFALSWA